MSVGHEPREQVKKRRHCPVTEILVIIVNYRTASLTEKCLEAVAQERAAGVNLSAILVDGCSGDGSVPQLRAFLDASDIGDWTELLALDFNGGFGWANNQAMLHRGDQLPPYIYLLNPDAEIEPEAISALAQILDDHSDVGAVGSQLLEVDGSKSASAFRFPSVRNEFVRGAQTSALRRFLALQPSTVEIAQAGPVDWVTGASVMLRRDALRQTGLFDDGFFLYFEEVELMQRLRQAGWYVWSEPASRVKHIGGASTGIEESLRPRARPAYWYRSRKRYFTLARGRTHGLCANLAWLFGYALIGLPRLLLSSASRSRAVPKELDGMSEAGFWIRSDEARRSAPPIGGAFGNLPSWSRDGHG